MTVCGRRRRRQRVAMGTSLLLVLGGAGPFGLLTNVPGAEAAIPHYALRLRQSQQGTTTTIWASGATFGGSLPFGTRSGPPPPRNADNGDADARDPNSMAAAEEMVVVEPPPDNAYLCDLPPSEVESAHALSPPNADAATATTAMLVPRGHCSFERKALAAQRYGAGLVVVRNTLESRYDVNATAAGGSGGGSTNNGTAGADYYGAMDAEEEEEMAGSGAAEEDAPPATSVDPPSGNSDADDDIIWPLPRHDYDCANGQAFVPRHLLSFAVLPYDAAHNDPLLSGTKKDGNLCAVYATPAGEPGGGEGGEEGGSGSFDARCESRRCLLTGRAGPFGEVMEACCAWDLPREMGGDPTLHYQPQGGNATEDTTEEDTAVTIPALFVTMADGYDLYESVILPVTTTTALAYERWHPYPNASTFLLWALGVGVTWLASYLSAWEYRKARKIIRKARREGRRVFRAAPAVAAPADATSPREMEEGMAAAREDDGDAENSLDVFEDEPEEEDEGMRDVDLDGEVAAPASSSVERIRGGYGPAGDASEDVPPPAADSTSPPAASVAAVPQLPQPQEQQHVDIGIYHVLGFVVFASAALFVLFYFEIYRVVTIMYGVGCSGAMALVLFQPLYRYLSTKISWLAFLQDSPCPKATFCGCNTFTFNEVLSGLSGYAIGISWLYIALTQLDPHTNTYFWVVQNIMGACVSIAFLGVIRVGNIKIATLLLIAVFIYDIFMVFITPHFTKEGDSIMVTVATSGGPPEDPDFCEKYPYEGDCRQGNPLPMLLAIPRINDYRGGGNLLGLGDIVLPGLLIAFAARLDNAKSLLKLCTEVYRTEVGGPMPRRPSGSTIASSVDDPGNQEMGTEKTGRVAIVKQLLFGGYFGPLTIAYGFGLAMAKLAVHLMQTAQPALLYLVPACLGTMVILGKAKGELKELWNGSSRIKKCDRIVSSVRSLF